MDGLILFSVRVAVGLLLEAGASNLSIYAFPLIQIARKCVSCIYRFCSSFSDQAWIQWTCRNN
jgi:hypothetical protein